jgi:hypothetical protein
VVITVRNIDPDRYSTVADALSQKMGPSDDSIPKMLGEPAGTLGWGSDYWLFVSGPQLLEGKPGTILMNKNFLMHSLSAQDKKAQDDL